MKYSIYAASITIIFLAGVYLGNSEFMQQDKCLDGGGQWNKEKKWCEGKAVNAYFLLGPDTTGFLSRVTLCNHWRGEAPYADGTMPHDDASKARLDDIENNINALKCSELSSEKIRLESSATPYQRELIENYLRQNQLEIP